jgi:hypothetical protein
MTDHKPIRLGDNVRVRLTPETKSLGLAGKIGQVYGHTTPFVTCIKFIGDTQQDLAFNVFFKDRNKAFWFAPELLELADDASETEVQVGTKKWMRSGSGEWKESPKSSALKPIAPRPIEPVGLLGRLLKTIRKKS